MWWLHTLQSYKKISVMPFACLQIIEVISQWHHSCTGVLILENGSSNGDKTTDCNKQLILKLGRCIKSFFFVGMLTCVKLWKVISLKTV